MGDVAMTLFADENVVELREMREGGASYQELADWFDCSVGSVWRYLNPSASTLLAQGDFEEYKRQEAALCPPRYRLDRRHQTSLVWEPEPVPVGFVHRVVDYWVVCPEAHWSNSDTAGVVRPDEPHFHNGTRSLCMSCAKRKGLA